MNNKDLDSRIKNLSNWLDTHPHDEEVKEYGQCKYCHQHLEDLKTGMKQFSLLMLGICAVIVIVFAYYKGIEPTLELLGIVGLIGIGYYLFMRYVPRSCF